MPIIWLTGRLRQDLRSPAALIGQALIAQALFHWCGREAAVAIVVAFLLLGVVVAAPVLPTAETAVVLATTIVLGYVIYLLSKLPEAVRLALLFVRLRLSPRRLARAIVVHLLRRTLEDISASLKTRADQHSWLSRRSYELLALLLKDDLDTTAYTLAREIEPELWGYAMRVMALALVPWFVVLASFRIAITYGQLLDRGAHLGFFEALAYPIAALVDVLFHSDFRAVLRGS